MTTYCSCSASRASGQTREGTIQRCCSGVEDRQSRTIIMGSEVWTPELLTSSVSPSGGETRRDPLTGLQMSEMRHILRETCVAPWSKRQSGKTINRTQLPEPLPKPRVLLHNRSLYHSLSSKTICMQRLSRIPHNQIIIHSI